MIIQLNQNNVVTLPTMDGIEYGGGLDPRAIALGADVFVDWLWDKLEEEIDINI